MSLTLWEPLRRLDDFDRVVDDLLASRRMKQVERAWKPAADLVAEKDAYVFRFDIPGVAKDRIDIDVVDGVLTVQGKREDRSEAKDEEGRVFRRETFVGTFKRSFRLPDNVDTASITADHENGVLEVRVPKAAETQARRIQIGNA
jgi:HSP20 family protein